MSEYTPTKQRILSAYISNKKKALGPNLSIDDCVAEFDRFIASVKSDQQEDEA